MNVFDKFQGVVGVWGNPRGARGGEWVVEIYIDFWEPIRVAMPNGPIATFTIKEAMLYAKVCENNTANHYRIRNLRTGDVLPAVIL